MKQNFKRTISLLLCFIMLVSLLPAYAAEPTEQEIPLTAFFAKNGKSYVSGDIRGEVVGGVLTWKGIQTRRYSSADDNTDDDSQFGAIKFVPAVSGSYNLYFKTNSTLAHSAIQEIYVGEYEASMEGAKKKSALIGNATEGVGRFDFSSAEKDRYKVLENAGEKVTLDLTAGKTYYIMFAPDKTSLALNPNTVCTDNPELYPYGTAVNLLEEGYIDSNGNLIKDTNGDGTLESKDLWGFTQEMYVSGIKLVPAGQEVTEDIVELPDKILIAVGADILMVGDTYPIAVSTPDGKLLSKGVDFSYASCEPEIATVSDSGVISPLEPGRTKITVTAKSGDDEVSGECEINVIGANILNSRQWKNAPALHGEFANDIHLTDNSGVSGKQSYWKATRNLETGYAAFDYELMRDVVFDVTGKTTNIAKFSLHPTEGWNRLLIESLKRAWKNASDQRWMIEADANKLYEFSGYIKSENTNDLPPASIYVDYHNEATADGVSIKKVYSTPWDGKSGDQPWTKFTVNSMYLNYGYSDVYGLRTSLNFTTEKSLGVDILLACFSVNEVVLDRVELKLAEKIAEFNYGDTVATELLLYSNTGNPIELGAAFGNGEARYTSMNDGIVTVDEETGVITAVSNGETTIKAAVTINGVTKEALLPITVGGVKKVIHRAVVSADKTDFIIGETANTSYTVFYNDGEQYTDESNVYYYESSDASVASVSQDGVITANKQGKADIKLWIETGERELCGILQVAVTDNTALKVAKIRGSQSVEAGFETCLSAYAEHESGKAAEIEACEVSFALQNQEDAEYLIVARNGTITGIKERESPVNVVATVTSGGVSVTSVPFEVTVTPNSPKSKMFDFGALPDVVWPYYVEIDTWGWAINRKKSAYRVGMAPGNRLRFQGAAGIVADIVKTGDVQEADLAIDFNVDYDGWYDVVFTGMEHYKGAKSADIFIDGKYAGDFCFWTDLATNYKFQEVKPLNAFYLTKGVHTLTIKATSFSPTEGTKANIIPTRLSITYLEGFSGLKQVNLSADKTDIAVGESSALSSTVVMENGREYRFGLTHEGNIDDRAKLVFESSDISVATVDSLTRTVRAISPGMATITAIAVVEDEEKIATVDITVNEEILSDFEVKAKPLNIFLGQECPVEISAYLGENKKLISDDDLTVSCKVIGADIVSYSNGKLLGKELGETEVELSVTLGSTTLIKTIPVYVISENEISFDVTAVSQTIRPESDGTDIIVKGCDKDGETVNISSAEIGYRSSDESVITIDGRGHITPVSEGVAEAYVTVIYDGITYSDSVTISVRKGKVTSTYYTPQEIANARENVKKYDWAKEMMKSAVEEADRYLPYYDYIYNMIPAHTIPRAYDLVETEDPEIDRCFYCGTDLNFHYGTSGWQVNAITRPWKIQCAECKRLFPSNDFESYYKKGLDEHGEFDYTLAREENGILCGRGYRDENGKYIVYDEFADNPYGYGDPKGNLYNELYNELYKNSIDPWKKIPITQGWGDFKVGEGSSIPSNGYFWGVDDGLGYDTGRYILTTDGDEEIRSVQRYIAVFAHDGLWYASSKKKDILIWDSIIAFRDAYLYTGEKKYGIAGAILLDRVADLYPDMDYRTDCLNLRSSHGGNYMGRVVGNIWENSFISPLVLAYDVFFDCYDEPEVINYLSAKAEQWSLDNKKTSGELVRQNVEKNILEEVYKGVKNAQIQGNYGMYQGTLIKAAVVLDRQPETQEMIDFTYQDGTESSTACTGGTLRQALVNLFYRDGYANEASMGYNQHQVGVFIDIANLLEGYPGLREEDDLSKNPKFIKMLLMASDTILTGDNTPNIGDASSTFGRKSALDYTDWWFEGFKRTKEPIFAQLLWYAGNGNVKDLHYDVFTKNPESLQAEIKKVIDEQGELELSKSSIATGYGFAALRAGVLYNDVTAPTRINTMRDWWMYFGGAAGTHKHMDALNLGIDAFGMDLSPDLGYYSASGGAGTGQGENWIESTLSHNTVLVNDKPQVRITEAGNPLHFDDAGTIKVMDVDVPHAYPSVTDTYRRTIVSVDVDDSVSYALDFFRIVGGDEHLYSFHSLSEESVVEGVTLIPQPRGSYAGVDVPFGEEAKYTATNGYNWLANVERAANPETGQFSVDFKITDYQKVMNANRNLHLKLTQLNGFNICEIARADGQPVQKERNPEFTDYILVRRSGKDLETLFTSVIEPYEDESKIKSLSRMNISRKDGKELRMDEPVAAIKVELVNGRIDYVVYSADNSIDYTVTDTDDGVSFGFTGFVGVYSVNSEDVTDVVRTYLHDGETLGTVHENAVSAVTGEILDFTKTLEFENYIEATVNENIDPKELVGKMIVVDNDKVQNGSYIIESARKEGDKLILGVGNVTFIRSLEQDGLNYMFKDSYVFNIAEGQSYRIPLTATTDAAPEISVSGMFTTSAGSSISIPLDVVSDREYTLVGTSLPRGMSLNAKTGVLNWKPDDSQVGENHVAITVNNGVLSDTVHFTVTVYGSTTSKPSGATDDTETPSTGTSGGGSSGGGGGGDTVPEASGKTDNGETDTSDETNNGNPSIQPDVGNGGSDVPQFMDLDNHAWAADAINSLAAEGIIKGTSMTTFSPAANITRADFALLLVRAFKLESANTENFADVSASEYFASELAIARNTNIVNGIGDNKFAPRNTITRQDMMVIVYRALTTLGVELSTGDVGYPDFDTVAPYAQDAVKALITAGLVNGKNGNIAPNDYTTRAEVAVLIKRVLDYVK